MKLKLNSGITIEFDEFLEAWLAVLSTDLDSLVNWTNLLVASNTFQRTDVKNLTYAIGTRRVVEVCISVKKGENIVMYSEYCKTLLAATKRITKINKLYGNHSTKWALYRSL